MTSSDTLQNEPYPIFVSKAISTTSLIEKLKPNREIAEPVYQQLLCKILELIACRDIGEHSSLPSERLLAEKLDLSRTTVKRCYDELRAMNYITSHGRAGVRITAKKPERSLPRLSKPKGFTEEMQELGIEPSTRLLEKSIITDRTIASIFGRPSTARFLRVIRLRLGDDTPMSREVAWYDLTAVPELADWDASGSAYQHLMSVCNVNLVEAEQTIEAVQSSEAEANALELAANSPCLLIKRKTFNAAKQLIEYVESTFRGDVYTYRVQLDVNAENMRFQLAA